MLKQQTFQYRAYTSKAGYADFDQVLGQLCLLYNAALEERIISYNADRFPDHYRYNYGIGKPGKEYTGTATLKCWGCGVQGEYYVRRALCEACNERKEKVSRTCDTCNPRKGYVRRANKCDTCNERKGKNPGKTFYEQKRLLTKVRKSFPDYDSFNRRVQVGVLQRLDFAYKNFFRRVKAGEEKPGFPRFKPFSRFQTIETDATENAWLKESPDGKRLFLKINGLPRLMLKTGRRGVPEGKLTAVRLTRKDCGITASLTFAVEKEPLPTTGAMVGIDVGVRKLIATSDGEIIEPFPTDDPVGRGLQRRLSRRFRPGKSHSRRYKELRRQLRRHRAKKRLQNRNRLHRITTDLVRNYDFIGIEDLQRRSMTRSAKGTMEAPGRNVRQKSGLNQSILAQSWGLFADQLEYKAEWAGKTLVAVPPQYTSQTCAACGEVSAENRKGEDYACSTCGYEQDADTNAAINILRCALSAAGPNPSPGRPQDAIAPTGEVCDNPSAPEVPPPRQLALAL